MKNQLPLALLFTLGGIFAAMGALLLYVALLKPLLLTWKSSSWIETPATVTECRLENRSRGAMTIVIVPSSPAGLIPSLLPVPSPTISP